MADAVPNPAQSNPRRPTLVTVWRVPAAVSAGALLIVGAYIVCGRVIVYGVLGMVFAFAVLGTVRFLNCQKRPSVASVRCLGKSVTRVLLIASAFYLLSIGPAGYLCIGSSEPERFADRMSQVYFPIIWASTHGPAGLRGGIEWYCTRWINAAGDTEADSFRS